MATTSNVVTKPMPMRSAALLEVLAVVLVAYGTRRLLQYWGAGFAGGASSTILAVLLSAWLLRRRGGSWADLGLKRPAKPGSAASWTVALFLVALLVVPAVSAVIGNALHFPAQHLEIFARLQGNLGLYLVLLIPVTWGTAAFGEELVCRGFIMRRLGDALGGSGAAEFGALLGQAVLFGLAHGYLGPRGMLNAGALGLLFGCCYQLSGRNLWPLFVAHGLVDTVGITMLYLGLAHG